jgi:hypothetical protein
MHRPDYDHELQLGGVRDSNCERTIMTTRKAIPPDVQSQVLLASARRCALCYGLHGDLDVKNGQIAHLDGDNSNPSPDNLVFLCFDHHDRFDSKTSQSKGIKPQEVIEYRQRLNDAILRKDHVAFETTKSDAQKQTDAARNHDEKMFRESDAIMSEHDLTHFLDRLQGDHSFVASRIHVVDAFARFSELTSNEYISSSLSTGISALLESLVNLQDFVGRHFFVFPDHQAGDDWKLCLYPDLNVDRRGSGKPEDMKRYDEFAGQLNKIANAVRDRYREYRRGVKRELHV